ncbi:hypothetical protein [Lentilactobacillus kisonensis]|uniref:Uncharacterized protein n=2 Tax=Lentilactobacillus kisonensis TaxID=481722 RepID=H1LKJ8_9LACO|nr:hypothetical protein [Lentilactobacillus kisonensis]EHO46647.1 hypothetical protein HMPREF9104_03152 [Lentilactobacillus kisonensis F0435]KRL22433.1 hypothetical protein FC98_GL002569 [Lentilactobacillus kisonensis DSM 19906 = JCM 15041]
MHKKFKLITAALATTVVAGGLALISSTPTTTVQAANTFASSEVSGPSGYFYNSKIGLAFHWRNLKTNRGVQTIMVMGDFKTPKLTTGLPIGNSISKDKRTFTANYKQLTNKNKLTKTNYQFNLRKLSTNKYQVKVAKYGNSRLPSNKGKNYTFYRTKKSPAKSLATKFTRPTLEKALKKQYDQNVEAQYQKAKAAGQNVKDPATDPAIQKQRQQYITTGINSYIKQIVKAFG